MRCLGGFDGLEVALFRDVGDCTVGREVGGARLPRGRVAFLSEEGKQGGPPELRSVGRAFGGGVGGEEGGDAREVSVEPGFKGKSGGERRRRGDGEVLEKRNKGGPVGQGPIGGGSRGSSKWMSKYYLDRDVVRARGGEGGVPCLAKGKQRRGSKGKIRQRVVDIEVPHHKGGVAGFGESNQRGNSHLRCPFGPEIVQIQDAKVRERLPKKINLKHVVGDHIGPVEQSR